MKRKRLSKILDLIAEFQITTQEELQSLLKKSGFDVTQATVSRDIKDLHLIKSHDDNNIYRYMSVKSSQEKITKYQNIFLNAVISVDYALNSVVLKCHTGMAMAACAALDQMNLSMIVGTLAGDDTILIITRSEEKSAALVYEINELLNRNF